VLAVGVAEGGHLGGLEPLVVAISSNEHLVLVSLVQLF
jgi:hypothetical protein